MREVVYRDCVLAKGSRALELWELWQKAPPKERNRAQKVLDEHCKAVEQKALDLLTRYRSDNESKI